MSFTGLFPDCFTQHFKDIVCALEEKLETIAEETFADEIITFMKEKGLIFLDVFFVYLIRLLLSFTSAFPKKSFAYYLLLEQFYESCNCDDQSRMRSEFKDFFLSKGSYNNCDYRMLFELCKLEVISAPTVEEILNFWEGTISKSSIGMEIFTNLLFYLGSFVKEKLSDKFESYIQHLGEEVKTIINEITAGNILGLFSQVYDQNTTEYKIMNENLMIHEDQFDTDAISSPWQLNYYAQHITLLQFTAMFGQNNVLRELNLSPEQLEELLFCNIAGNFIIDRSSVFIWALDSVKDKNGKKL